MIGLLIDIKKDTRNTNLAADDIRLAVEFTPWFFVSLVAFAAGAFFCYRRMLV